tara:strand:+ start:78 stop:389 length:312 start_codon:yes stop_codon:yes gene_type:complete
MLEMPLISDDAIRLLGDKIMDCIGSEPIAFVKNDDFILVMKGHLISVTNGKTAFTKPFWFLPESQSTFIYCCLMRWIWSAKDFYPCLLSGDARLEENWGEADA